MGCPFVDVLAGVVPVRLTSARCVRRCLAGRGGGRSDPVGPRAVVRMDGDRQRTGSPPTPCGPCLCPPPRRGSERDRSARRGRGAPEVTLPPWRLPWVLIR